LKRSQPAAQNLARFTLRKVEALPNGGDLLRQKNALDLGAQLDKRALGSLQLGALGKLGPWLHAGVGAALDAERA
jgi:hypothetical protein